MLGAYNQQTEPRLLLQGHKLRLSASESLCFLFRLSLRFTAGFNVWSSLLACAIFVKIYAFLNYVHSLIKSGPYSTRTGPEISNFFLLLSTACIGCKYVVATLTWTTVAEKTRTLPESHLSVTCILLPRSTFVGLHLGLALQLLLQPSFTFLSAAFGL